MNVKDLREWLKQFPEDAEVEVLSVDRGTQWSEDCTSEVAFEGEDFKDFDFTDFTDNKFVKQDSPLFNKKVLLLGNND